MHRLLLLLALSALVFVSCKKDDDGDETPVPRLILKFKFDSTQVRLNNFGQPTGVVAGHGAQSPVFNRMSAHYVEFAPDSLTALGGGKVVYHAPETDQGGATGINHDLSQEIPNGGDFLNIPITDLVPGTYRWLRVSLAYQNYSVKLQYGSQNLVGTVASFIGYNTYIGSYLIRDSIITVNDDRLQGYWGFEVNDLPIPVVTGQAPAGSTTVPNPINGSSPIPAGSCVVTGAFPVPLTITGNETSDVVIEVSLSTNRSFEWIEADGDNVWEPALPNSETVVDMGVRGLVPTVQ